jgi:putative effector of murein hydrolase
VAAIIFGGFYVSLVMTAYSVLGIRKVVRPNNTNISVEKETTPGVNTQARTATAPQPQPPYSDNLAKRLRIATITTGVAASMLSKTSSLIATTPLVSAFMLFSTMNNFVFGSRLPAKFKKVCHPLVVCTTLTWLSAHLLSWTTGLSFLSLIHGYKTGSLNILTGGGGAGDLFLFCLGPAITSFAVSMYEKRQLMRDNMAEVGTSILVASISGLFGTAALTRLFGLAKIASLSLLSRHITSALAMVTGSILGADISLTVSIAILTGLLGANFGASILDFWRIKCPVARGLAIGAASHGLGTAAISHEKDAFPFAAIAMTLVASFSAVLVSIPPIKIALVKLALGGA